MVPACIDNVDNNKNRSTEQADSVTEVVCNFLTILPSFCVIGEAALTNPWLCGASAVCCGGMNTGAMVVRTHIQPVVMGNYMYHGISTRFFPPSVAASSILTSSVTAATVMPSVTI